MNFHIEALVVTAQEPEEGARSCHVLRTCCY